MTNEIFQNGYDLQERLLEFLENKENVVVFSPYTKKKKLLQLLEHCEFSVLVVRWLPVDILSGASDLEVYDVCKERGITLYRNPRLHLKAFSDEKSLFFGSANISERGISLESVKQFNYELATVANLDFRTRIYLKRVILESSLITEDLINQYGEQIGRIDKSKMDPEDFQPGLIDPFLLSSLPMTQSIELLIEIYAGSESDFSQEELQCAAHDLALYVVPDRLSPNELEKHLQSQFNAHPFIIVFKNFIEGQPGKSSNYGGVIRWIQNNTTSVPIPRSWELKQMQIVNILYEWVCYFDSNFYWDQPNISQVIYKKE